eukprot:CFRG1868T1
MMSESDEDFEEGVIDSQPALSNTPSMNDQTASQTENTCTKDTFKTPTNAENNLASTNDSNVTGEYVWREEGMFDNVTDSRFSKDSDHILSNETTFNDIGDGSRSASRDSRLSERDTDGSMSSPSPAIAAPHGSTAILQTNSDEDNNDSTVQQVSPTEGKHRKPIEEIVDKTSTMSMADQLQEAAGTNLLHGYSEDVSRIVNEGVDTGTGSDAQPLADDVRTSSTRKSLIRKMLTEYEEERLRQNSEPNAHTRVSVTNPRRHGEGMRAYVVYDVRSRHGVVQRRYNDFCWLHAQLLETCPGVILPGLPDKQPLGRFDSDFLDRRCMMLDAYLSRIAQHEDLSRAGAYLEFCTTLNSLPTNSNGAVVDSSAGVELARFLGSIGTVFAARTGINISSMGIGEGEHSGAVGEDRWFEDKATANKNVETCLTNVYQALAALQKCDLEQGRAYVMLGRSFQTSGMEEVDTHLTTRINLVSSIQESLRAIYLEIAAHTEKLDSIIKEHIGMTQALNTLLQNRRQVRSRSVDAKNIVRARKDALSRRTQENVDDEGSAEASVEEAEKVARNLDEQLSTLSTTIRKEADNLDKDRSRDLSLALVTYARSRVGCQRQIVSSWERCKRAVCETLPTTASSHNADTSSSSTSGNGDEADVRLSNTRKDPNTDVKSLEEVC